jgi:hypothetical protein
VEEITMSNLKTEYARKLSRSRVVNIDPTPLSVITFIPRQILKSKLEKDAIREKASLIAGICVARVLGQILFPRS